MGTVLQLPMIDLCSADQISTARLIRQACLEHGFFYVKNHGIAEELIEKVFIESKNFFSLPLQQKMALFRRDFRGYTPLYAEKLDVSLSSIGDSKESFYFGASEGNLAQRHSNQWPSKDLLPSWRPTMESYYNNVLSVGRKLLGLIAMSLNLDENFFVHVGALNDPAAVVRLIHYPGDIVSSNEEIYGASAHSDYGTITLLATDGVPGLQVCREKWKQPRVWEDVQGLKGAFVVNIGDLMERWTNGLYRSTMHRVMPVGKERYSVAFFLDPNPDCVVDCLESCCSQTSPPRFPLIRAGDYLNERFRLTYGS